MSDEASADVSAAIVGAFAELPYAALLGIDVVEADDGRATAELELREAFQRNPTVAVAHRAVTYALADTAAGAAMVSRYLDVTPTVDMHIDYHSPASTDLTATAEVVRAGDSVATVDVLVTGTEGRCVATARGTYKAGGSAGESPWTANREYEAPE